MRMGFYAVGVVALSVAGVAVAAGVGGPRDSQILGPDAATVALDINYSRFGPERLVVRAGTTVTFEVTNNDPILHEVIVGGPDVHERHEGGTDAAHPPVPGEVTVPPGEAATTTYTFDKAGTVLFACHLPGHLAYGMYGTVEVLP